MYLRMHFNVRLINNCHFALTEPLGSFLQFTSTCTSCPKRINQLIPVPSSATSSTPFRSFEDASSTDQQSAHANTNNPRPHAGR